jgi:hypothetical protein
MPIVQVSNHLYYSSVCSRGLLVVEEEYISDDTDEPFVDDNATEVENVFCFDFKNPSLISFNI